MDLKKNILYEDDDVLAIDKPAGLVVHPDGRTVEPSVSEWFAAAYPGSRDVGEPSALANGQVIERPGVVHRIDRDTSGVLLLAKTKEGHRTLKEQFQEREIEKIYHLFVYGLVKEDHGSITLKIGRSASNSRKWSAQRGARGELREALTYFRVLKRADDNSATFLEARPKTGRTHQIRVHFQALHHPVVADKIYATTKPPILGFERLALHARAIKFRNVEGREISVEAPYPEDFKRAIDTI
jgi:23S rRNA pseudouridine1911/1915/1917 synthase